MREAGRLGPCTSATSSARSRDTSRAFARSRSPRELSRAFVRPGPGRHSRTCYRSFMRFRGLAGAVAIVAIVAALAPMRAADQTADEFAQAVQRKYDAIK